MILFSAYALAVLAYLIGGALQGRALMNKPVCSRNLILMLGLAGAIAQAFSLSHTLITDNGLRFDFFITASARLLRAQWCAVLLCSGDGPRQCSPAV